MEDGADATTEEERAAAVLQARQRAVSASRRFAQLTGAAILTQVNLNLTTLNHRFITPRPWAFSAASHLRPITSPRAFAASTHAPLSEQAAYRMRVARADFVRAHACAVRLQARWRCAASRAEFVRLKRVLLMDETVACDALRIILEQLPPPPIPNPPTPSIPLMIWEWAVGILKVGTSNLSRSKMFKPPL